jgi:hypothetical protein
MEILRRDVFLGLDLGQSHDFTALGLIERITYAGDWDGATWSHRNEISTRLRHLERSPLGTSYPDIVARVGEVMRSPALADARRNLIVDATGVGRPVVDLLEREDLPCRIWAVTITGGASEGFSKATHRVPKRDLIILLQVMLQQKRLEIASGLREGAALMKELADMRVQLTSGGREKFGARSGEHDDLVLAVALACWGLDKVEGRGTIGFRGDGRLV